MKLALILCVLGSSFTWAKDGLDSASQEALQQTLQVLMSPGERGKVISGSPDAKQADQQVRDLMGSPENAQRLYELAGKIMETLALQAEGDPEKMAAILENAKRDPASFANTFTPEQKRMLKDLSTLVEKSGTQKKVP